MEREQPDDKFRADFDSLIRAHGRRFVVGARVRFWAWRIVHEPAWAHGLIAATTMFGAPGIGACAHTPRTPSDGLVPADQRTR